MRPQPPQPPRGVFTQANRLRQLLWNPSWPVASRAVVDRDGTGCGSSPFRASPTGTSAGRPGSRLEVCASVCSRGSGEPGPGRRALAGTPRQTSRWTAALAFLTARALEVRKKGQKAKQRAEEEEEVKSPLAVPVVRRSVEQ